MTSLHLDLLNDNRQLHTMIHDRALYLESLAKSVSVISSTLAESLFEIAADIRLLNKQLQTNASKKLDLEYKESVAGVANILSALVEKGN